MANFLPLDSLKKMLSSTQADLRTVREIDQKLKTQIATLRTQSQYTPQYQRQEAARLRSEAKELAALYLNRERTSEALATIRQQDYSVPRYLAHAATNDTGSDTPTLLKKMLLMMSLQRTTTAGLSDTAQAMADRGDWQGLGVVHNEAQYRKASGDEAAAALVAGIMTVTIPQLDEAKALAHEAQQVEEALSYSQRSISNGSEDLSLKAETWQQEAAAKREQQAAERAH